MAMGMRVFTFIAVSLFAASAFAQSASPIMIIGGDEPARNPQEEANVRALTNFPESAITRAANVTNGSSQDIPPAPASPAAPTAPVSGAAASSPTAPAAPASPVSKLWPVNTVPIFMRTCVGFRPTLFAPCQCVIGRMMREFPHDEFLELTAKGTIEQDPRLENIRVACANEPPAETK